MRTLILTLAIVCGMIMVRGSLAGQAKTAEIFDFSRLSFMAPEKAYELFGPKTPAQLRISMLPVGAGNCVVIECPVDRITGKTPIIINDCGSSGSILPGWSTRETAVFVTNLLNNYGNNRGPVTLVVSHPDIDHYNIFHRLDPKFPTIIYIGGDEVEYANYFQDWLRKVNSISDGNVVKVLGFTERVSGLSCGTGAAATIVTGNASSGGNSGSLVLGIKYANKVALLTGDSTAETLVSTVQNAGDLVFKDPKGYLELPTSFLLAPHHGSTSEGSNSLAFAKMLRPEVVFLSAGNRFAHPRCQAMEEYNPQPDYLKIIANYFPRLIGSPPHPIRCGEDGNYTEYLESRAIYLTTLNGLVTYTWDSNGSTISCYLNGLNQNCTLSNQ